MSLGHAILGFLKSGPLSGYDLKTRCFDGVASAVWTADQAQVYRTLDRLESSGLVTSRLIAQRGRPDRKTYSLTAKGTRELSGWVDSAHPQPPLRDPFLLQLLFADEVPPDVLLGVLRDARDQHQRRLDVLRGQATTPEPVPSGAARGAVPVRRMAQAGAIAKERCVIDWLDDCIEKTGARDSTTERGTR